MSDSSGGTDAGDRERATQSGALGASIRRAAGGGWLIRVPLRAEQVTVHKRVYVVEEVDIQRELVDEVETVQDTVRRERLDVNTSGDLAVTQRTARLPRRP